MKLAEIPGGMRLTACGAPALTDRPLVYYVV